MTTSKVDTSGVFQPLNLQSHQTKLSIPADAIRFRRNGIEFASPQSVPLWTEMTVDLRSPIDGRRLRSTGIVVECSGNRHMGYLVSIIFMSLSRQAQEQLSHLASSQMV